MLVCKQVLEYNVEAATWTQIGKLEKGRYNHAIAEVHCPVGNLNPINKFADKNFMTRMFRRSTVSWSPSENMWNVSLLRILAPPMLARYVTVPKVSVFLAVQDSSIGDLVTQ